MGSISEQDKFLAESTFRCGALHAYITPAQCEVLREAPESPGPGGGTARPPQCRVCDWRIVQEGGQSPALKKEEAMPTVVPKTCKGCGEEKILQTKDLCHKCYAQVPKEDRAQQPEPDYSARFPMLAQVLSDPAIWCDEAWSRLPVARVAEICAAFKRRGLEMTGQGLSYILRHAGFPSRDVHGGTSWQALSPAVKQFIEEHGGTVPALREPGLVQAIQPTPAQETPAELFARLQACFPGQRVELRITGDAQ